MRAKPANARLKGLAPDHMMRRIGLRPLAHAHAPDLAAASSLESRTYPAYPPHAIRKQRRADRKQGQSGRVKIWRQLLIPLPEQTEEDLGALVAAMDDLMTLNRY